jgi:hypothetical protein
MIIVHNSNYYIIQSILIGAMPHPLVLDEIVLQLMMLRLVLQLVQPLDEAIVHRL